MALSNVPVFVQTPQHAIVTVANADASNLKTVMTGGTNGTKVVALNLTSDDTVSRIVTWGITKSGGSFGPLGSVTVPIGSGTDGTNPTVDGFGDVANPALPKDQDGQHYIILEYLDTLQVKTTTTVTAAKTVTAQAIGADF